ncbi:MAG: hypothetical protein ACI81P_003630 [Neolewinella sp.]
MNANRAICPFPIPGKCQGCGFWLSLRSSGILFSLVSGAGRFNVFHLLAGIFITWYAITRFLNRTKITVDRDKMQIDHGPIPWPFAKENRIPARSLVQLYVIKGTVKVNDQPTYSLKAKLDTGERYP